MLGEHASTVRETEHPQERPKHTHGVVFSGLGRFGPLFEIGHPPGHDARTDTETQKPDSTPNAVRPHLTPT